jgi:hypothetical protein
MPLRATSNAANAVSINRIVNNEIIAQNGEHGQQPHLEYLCIKKDKSDIR